MIRTQFFDERFVFQFLRLQHRQPYFQRVFLHVRELHLVSAPGRFVRHRHHGNHIISAFHQRPQTRYGKLRRS